MAASVIYHIVWRERRCSGDIILGIAAVYFARETFEVVDNFLGVVLLSVNFSRDNFQGV